MSRRAPVLPVLLALLLIAGCSSRTERLYRRAEAFLAQGQFQMAAEEYQRLVSDDPRHPLADDAVYKLAYIYAEELGQPGAALVQYRALADNYPNSPYVDEALMRAMTIQRREFKDPEAVRALYEEICARFSERSELCARALLELARAYFDVEDYDQAAQVAGELDQRYPDQSSVRAQAALLRARACERQGMDPAEVEKLYERVVELYPDTHAAAMAKRSIGWIYYGRREEQQQQQQAEIRRRSRIIRGVPAYRSPDGQVVQALAALGAVLAHRGEQRSLDTLVALSGAPFVMVFDPERPQLAGSALDERPFEIVADALGFAYNVLSAPDAATAFESVHQALLQGHPVLILYGSPRRWIIVTGYDMAEQRVYYLPPDREDYATADRDAFLSAWAKASGSGSGVAGPEPFHQFSLGARMSTPDRAEILRTCVQRAAWVMRAGTIGDAPAGEEAWKALGAYLEACAAPDAGLRREAVARWAEQGLRSCLSLAESGTDMLREAASAVPGLDDAAERHRELLAEAALVARKIDEAVTAEEDAAAKWQAAAAQANYVAALHARLAQQLTDAVGG